MWTMAYIKKTSNCNSTSISPDNHMPCPKMITTSKKFIKIQGLWWVVMQDHIYLNVNILSIHHIKNDKALLIITYKVKHTWLYFWFHYQYADISSEVRFMRQAALKNTLYHGWSCWRKMYNSIYNINTNALHIRCCFHKVLNSIEINGIVAQKLQVARI